MKGVNPVNRSSATQNLSMHGKDVFVHPESRLHLG
jgi:hypothetical protein